MKYVYAAKTSIKLSIQKHIITLLNNKTRNQNFFFSYKMIPKLMKLSKKKDEALGVDNIYHARFLSSKHT